MKHIDERIECKDNTTELGKMSKIYNKTEKKDEPKKSNLST